MWSTNNLHTTGTMYICNLQHMILVHLIDVQCVTAHCYFTFSALKLRQSVRIICERVRKWHWHLPILTGLTPPAPSSVSATHPLLVRHEEPRITVTNPVIGTILHRSGRERDTYRYNPNTQTLHVQRDRMRRPNPSAVLQRYRYFAFSKKKLSTGAENWI